MAGLLTTLAIISFLLIPVFFVIAIISLIRKKPIKKWFFATGASAILWIVFLMIPTCEHEWIAATCSTPKTCLLCEKTEGDVIDHLWVDATCSAPKHCSVCDITDGETLEHTWIEATCVEAKKCSVCGYSNGSALGHEWVDATTEAPKTCTICGKTEGLPLINYDEITSKVVSGYNDALDYAKKYKYDADYAYNDVRDMLVKLNSAAYINDTEEVKVQYYKLFGDYTGYTARQLQQQAQFVLNYVVADNEDSLSALMKQFNKMSSVSGTITPTEIDITVNNMAKFVDEMGELRPQILGGILAVINNYDYSWIDGNAPSMLQFTENGFTLHWKAVGNYKLNLE